MKKNNIVVWSILAVIFIIAATLTSLMPDPNELPYSSKSTAQGGTKAAYLLLSELGFQVERNTQENYDGDGVVIALGAKYLGNAENALTFEDDHRFTNYMIREHASEFVELMWPYRDSTIVFEEYGRSPVYETASEGEDITVWSITPLWVRVSIVNLLCMAFFAAFFYGQRLGSPDIPEEFSGRRPLESVQAMAGAMEKARVYHDCAEFYYKYCVRGGSQWDKQEKIRQRLENIRTEREALMLVSEMDARIKEYRDEGKGNIGRFNR